jgi:hypothetical protein
MGDNGSTTFDSNDFDLDGCNISEVILFLQKLARSPNASSMNMAFTKHITNALMKIREEKWGGVPNFIKQHVYANFFKKSEPLSTCLVWKITRTPGPPPDIALPPIYSP